LALAVNYFLSGDYEKIMDAEETGDFEDIDEIL
jgi:hypothetical protein